MRKLFRFMRGPLVVGTALWVSGCGHSETPPKPPDTCEVEEPVEAAAAPPPTKAPLVPGPSLGPVNPGLAGPVHYADSFEALHAIHRDTFILVHPRPGQLGESVLLRHANMVDNPVGEPWGLDGNGFKLLAGFQGEDRYVYVSPDAPFAYELASLDRRAPDAFETDAAGRLLAGDAVVVEYDAGAMRMLGALRAGPACAECHDAAPDTLLGAFSYRFVEMPDD